LIGKISLKNLKILETTLSVQYNALMALRNKFKNRTKGVVSSEEKDSKKAGTTQTKNPKKTGQPLAAGGTEAHAESRHNSL
jgi:hypothetical protein